MLSWWRAGTQRQDCPVLRAVGVGVSGGRVYLSEWAIVTTVAQHSVPRHPRLMMTFMIVTGSIEHESENHPSGRKLERALSSRTRPGAWQCPSPKLLVSNHAVNPHACVRPDSSMYIKLWRGGVHAFAFAPNLLPESCAATTRETLRVSIGRAAAVGSRRSLVDLSQHI
jgi:hypothetical protein